MNRITAIQAFRGGCNTPNGVRVLAQALQIFDDRPPRNPMELAISRKLADQMRRLVRQPASAAHVFRLCAEFPAIEALVDEFLMTAQIVLTRETNCVVLDGLLQRLQGQGK